MQAFPDLKPMSESSRKKVGKSRKKYGFPRKKFGNVLGINPNNPSKSYVGE